MYGSPAEIHHFLGVAEAQRASVTGADVAGIGSGHRISGLKRPSHRLVVNGAREAAVTKTLVLAVPRGSRGSQSSKRMSESAVGLMVPSTRQNGKDSETKWDGTCPTMLNGGLILPAAVTEASPIFLPARLSQLAAAACAAPNEHKRARQGGSGVMC